MRRALPLLLALAPLAVVLGCGEEASEVAPVELVSEAAAIDMVGHLGRVHVILRPTPDAIEPEPELQISARFVEYRNVAEDFVRVRAKLQVPAWEQLEVGQCVASSSLLPAPPPSPAGEPELSLIDAGDLRVTIGTRELVVPLVLVPDILPWFSGVEYVHVDDRMPELALEPDGSFPLALTSDGSPELGLEPFGVAIRVSGTLELQSAKLADGRLVIDWEPRGEANSALLLRLQSFAPSEGIAEPSGEELTCLVPDSGRASLDVGPLEQAGLSTGASLLRVSASRFESHTLDTGAFEGVELIVELQDQRTLTLLGLASEG